MTPNTKIEDTLPKVFTPHITGEHIAKLDRIQTIYRCPIMVQALRLMIEDVFDLICSGDWEGIQQKLNNKRYEKNGEKWP